MSTEHDPAIRAALETIRKEVLDPKVAAEFSSSTLLVMSAHAYALAAQDAVAYARAVETVAVAGIAAAATRMVASEALEPYSDMIELLQKSVATAVALVATVEQDAHRAVHDGGAPVES